MTTYKLNDCLNESYNHLGNVSVLVFASHKRYGGGYRNHVKGQEEYLFNNTNLPNLYNDYIATFYPFKQTDTKGFVVTDNGIDFIFMPCLVWDSCGLLLDERISVIEERIKEIYSLNKSNTLILGGWGCGVFKCPPEIISRLFKKHQPNDLNVIYCFLDEHIKLIFEKCQL